MEAHNSSFEINVQYFEIYQESMNDLLSNRPEAKGLKMREQKNGSLIVLNATNISVTCPEDIFEALMIGQRTRAVASTNQNERSSRSHTIFVIDFIQKNTDGSQLTGRLNLVDLAGSERITKTGATGKVLEEAKVSSSRLFDLCSENKFEFDCVGALYKEFNWWQLSCTIPWQQANLFPKRISRRKLKNNFGMHGF